MLPDAYAWPTWGALRERILHACKLIKCEYSATVRDAFAAELVKLSPPRLATLSVCTFLPRLIGRAVATNLDGIYNWSYSKHSPAL